jgi:hypothetical protein
MLCSLNLKLASFLGVLLLSTLKNENTRMKVIRAKELMQPTPVLDFTSTTSCSHAGSVDLTDTGIDVEAKPIQGADSDPDKEDEQHGTHAAHDADLVHVLLSNMLPTMFVLNCSEWTTICD